MYVSQAATFEVLQVLHLHNLPGHAVWSEQHTAEAVSTTPHIVRIHTHFHYIIIRIYNI